MSYNPRTSSEIKQQIIEQLRDGIVLIESEEYVYSDDNDIYILSGASATNPTIVEILSVEGINEDGNWVPLEGSFKGVDAWKQGRGQILQDSEYYNPPTDDDPSVNYWLYWSGSRMNVSSSGSVYHGQPMYNAIRWNTTSGYHPKDGTLFRINYKYFDSSKICDANNFSDGTVLTTIIEAISMVLANVDAKNYDNFLDSFVRTADGDALDELAYPWGVVRRESTYTSGYLYIENQSSTESFTVSASHRFSTVDKSAIFQPTSFITLEAGKTGYITVRATTTGASQNVAPMTITKIWTDSSLTTEESNVRVFNPPTHLGQQNYFNNGSDRETDEELRSRILNASLKQGSATYSAIEGAIESIEGIAECKVYDIENKPFIAESYIQVFILGDNKQITNINTINRVEEVIKEKKPVGTRHTIYHPTFKYVYLDLSIMPDDGYWHDRNNILLNVENKINDYIADLKIGEDVVYSKLMDVSMNVIGVYSTQINKFYISTYEFTPYGLEYVIDLGSGAGTASGTRFAQQFYMGTKSYSDVYQYVSGSNTYVMSGSNITGVTVSTPLVYRALQDNDGNWIRNPLYVNNYYDSHTPTSITIVDSISGSNEASLQDGEDLLFIYENYEYDKIVGVVVNLSGTIGDQVSVSVWSGTNSGPTDLLTSGTITLDSSIAQDYFVEFDDVLTVTQRDEKHWVVVSGVSASGSLFLGTNAWYDRPISGELFYIATSGSWEITPRPMRFMVMMPISGTNNASVDYQIWKTEVASLFRIDSTAVPKVR